MLDFDDSTFLKEYDSYIPPVFLQTAVPSLPKPIASGNTVADYIPDIEYNSKGEVVDIIYIDDSCDEGTEDEHEKQTMQEPVRVTETRKDVIVISSDEEEEETPPAITRYKRKRKYSPPIIRCPKKSKPAKIRFKYAIDFRKSQRDRIVPDVGSFTGVLNCGICRAVLLPQGSKFPLSEKCTKKNRLLCTGCTRFVSLARTKQELTDMIQFFVTGKLPHYDLPPYFSDKEILLKLANRHLAMKARCTRKRGDGSQVVSLGELMDICRVSRGRCAITGWKCYLHDSRRSRLPYWALSFDHIIPVSRIHYKPEAWSMSNIQVMCSAINTIKGDYSDVEVKRWYDVFRKSHVVELD